MTLQPLSVGGPLTSRCADVDFDDRAKMNVAGDTHNTAIYPARLLSGDSVSVSQVTVSGRDRNSERREAHRAAHGVDTGYLERRDDRSSGLYAIDTDKRGEGSFTYWRMDGAARALLSEPDRGGWMFSRNSISSICRA